MANLFDGIKRIQRSELEEQLAGFEVYRISVYVRVLLRKGIVGLVWFWQKIMRLFHREIRLPETDSLELRFQAAKTELSCLSEEAFRKRMERLLKKKVHIAGKIGHRVGKTEDGFSADITRVAAGMWNKKSMHGFSVAEKNDFMFRDYPNRKKKKALFQLRIWLLGVFVIAGLSIVLSVWFAAKAVYILVAGIVIELVWLLWNTRQLARRQLVHFLWLASSGLGRPFAIEKEDTPTSQLSKEEKIRFDKEQRAYRTLSKMRKLQEENCNAMIAAQKEREKTAALNQKKIQELQSVQNGEAAQVTAEKKRMQEDKRLENEKLMQEYKEQQKLLQEQQIRLSELVQMEKECSVYETEKLGKLWKDAYSDFFFEPIFLEQLVREFSFEDLGRVEQRMEELKRSHDPFALAERKNGVYEIRFRTAQDGIAALRFIKGKAPQKKVIFQSVFRKNPLTETPVTEEEMKQLWASSKMEDDQKQAFLQLQKELLKQQEETKALLQKTGVLKQERNEIKIRLEKKQKEAKELNDIIARKQAECVRLEELLDKAKQEGDASSKALESAKNRYEELTKELSGYMKQSTGLSKELEKAREALSTNEKKIGQLQKEIQDKSEEAKKREKELKKQIRTAKEEKAGAIEKYRTESVELGNQLRLAETVRRQTEEALEMSVREEEKLRRELADAVAEKGISESRLQDLKNRLKNKETENAEKNKTIAKLKNSIKSLEDAEKSAQQKAKQAEKEVVFWQNEYEKEENRAKGQEQEIEDLKKLLEEASGRYNAALQGNAYDTLVQLFETRKVAIRQQITGRYKNIHLNDYVLSLFALLDGDLFERVAEPILSQMNYSFKNMEFVRRAEKSNLYEVNTELGCMLVNYKKKSEILAVFLRKNIRINYWNIWCQRRRIKKQCCLTAR